MIEFIEDSHQYLVDGILIPSVTQLLKRKWNSYAEVPQFVLDSASCFGINVHKAVECHGKGLALPKLSIYENLCYEEYLRLAEEYHIVPIENEYMVHHDYDYCGTIDLIAEINCKLALADVKTTSYIHEEEVQMQLSLYYYALKSMGYDIDNNRLYVIWLPKGKQGKLVEFELLSEEKVEEFLKEIELYD